MNSEKARGCARQLVAMAFILGGMAVVPLSAQALVVPTPTASEGTYAKYVKVKWSKVSGATGYRIKRSTTANYSEATTLKDVKVSVRVLNDYSAVAGQVYYYWVCPSDGTSYWHNDGKYARGYRRSANGNSNGSSNGSRNSTRKRYSISGSTSVKVGKFLDLTFSGPSAGWYTSNSCGYLLSNSGKSVRLQGQTPGSMKVYAVYDGVTYSKSITVKSDYNANTSGLSIKGNGSLKFQKSARYYLYSGGKKVTSGSVDWSCSAGATMQDKGSYGLLKATIQPATSSGKKVTVTARYSGRHCTKTVTITR